jgi:ribose transport system permease protein
MKRPVTKVSRWVRERPWGLATALALLLVVANEIARSSFATPSSWPATSATFAPFALAAIASTPQILSGGGGIDISIGPLLNFVSIVIVGVLIPHGLGSPAVIIPVAVGIGIAVGLINGVLVTVLRYQPVLATLCTLFVLEGASLKLLSQPQSGSTGWLGHLANQVGPVPGGLILIVVAVLIWAALGRLPYLRALYAAGGDDVASYSAGVNVTAVRIFAYALGGLFAALAGIALVAVTQSADANQSLQYTLSAIAAVAIGGTSLLGGRGGVGGSIAGAAVMFLIQTLLDSLGVSNNWVQLVYGALLLGTIVLGSRLLARPVGEAA